jgi:myo-inositol 2-dehydrogenase/D-chiro-inositol 1-dehydrogenase
MKKLNVGIAGLGRIGKVHIESLIRDVRDVRVRSVFSPRMDNSRGIAEQYGIESVKPNYRELVNDPGIDAVLICSPTETHTEQIIAAAEAGKDIFCEKPIALSLEEIQSALDAVKSAGVHLMIGFNRRFDSQFARVRGVVESGRLGEIELLRITSRDPAPPPPEYISSSGGMFLDMTIHDFDMARYITGSEVIEVFAEARVRVDPRIGDLGDIDTAAVTLSFENGALALIDNSRRACYGYDQRLEVFGSSGMAQINNLHHEHYQVLDSDGSHGPRTMDFFMDRYAKSYSNELKAFVRSILEGAEVPVTGQDGLKAVAVGLAAKRSVQEHRPVRVSEVFS